MLHDDDLWRVANGLYAAAADPELWNPAMESVTRLFGGDHAIMWAGGANSERAGMWSPGVDERDLARSVSASAACDPGALAPAALPIGAALTRSSLISDREHVRTAYYNECIRPLNGFHAVFFRQRNPATEFMLAVCRSPRSDDFDGVETSAMQMLMPHLSMALELHSRLQLAEHRTQALSYALDRSDAGVVLTQASGRPVFVNARAAAIAAACDGLMLDDGGLSASTPAITRKLRNAVEAAGAVATMKAGRIRLERQSPRSPLLLTILPISQLALLIPSAPSPRVAIFIQEADAAPSIDQLALIELFGLTRREAEVAALLASGIDLNAIAQKLDIGLRTVRFHLKQTYQKTGARNQSALVALVRPFTEMQR